VLACGPCWCVPPEPDVLCTLVPSRGSPPRVQAAADLRDAFRELHPRAAGFTYVDRTWRGTSGIAARFDAVLVSSALMPRVHDVWVATNAPRGDHLPFGIDINLSLGADAPIVSSVADDVPSAEARAADAPTVDARAAVVTMPSFVQFVESAVLLGRPDSPVSEQALAEREVCAGCT